MTEDEEFFAWLDGELDGDAAAKVEARVAMSPQLQGRAEQHRKLVAGLRQSFQQVVDGSGEAPRLQSADVVDFGARVTADERRRGWFSVPQWAAMAASLALGLVAGTQIDGPGSPVIAEGNRLVAAASLDEALDTRLASAPVAGATRIGLTFRDASGKVCRSFSDAAASGLACRDGGQWRIRGLFPASEGQSGSYRMAAGEDPRLAALVDESIAGEPFDAAQERAALKAGWR